LRKFQSDRGGKWRWRSSAWGGGGRGSRRPLGRSPAVRPSPWPRNRLRSPEQLSTRGRRGRACPSPMCNGRSVRSAAGGHPRSGGLRAPSERASRQLLVGAPALLRATDGSGRWTERRGQRGPARASLGRATFFKAGTENKTRHGQCHRRGPRESESRTPGAAFAVEMRVGFVIAPGLPNSSFCS
jgi:hypothetical protein